MKIPKFITTTMLAALFCGLAITNICAQAATSSLTNTQTDQPVAADANSASQSGGMSTTKSSNPWRLDSGIKGKKSVKAKKTTDSSGFSATLDAESDDAAQAQEPKPAASNGINPAELITRIEVKYQYQNFAGGDIHAVPVIRGDYAFTPKIALRVDLPILHFDSKTPGLKSESGIGDIVTSMTFVKIFSKRFVGAVVPRIDFPTATHSTLGSGKYSFKPLIAGVTPLAPGVGLVGTLEYRVSFAGKENRADINETSLRAILLKSFLTGPLKGYYANPQIEFIADFEQNNRTTTQFAVNVGKVLS